jgi:hypothetical protein
LLPDFALNRELAIQDVMARIQKCAGKWPGTRFGGVRPECTFT